ncbi:MAG: ATP-binding cassette domain-containing protein [Flavobacteriales bacterium]|nr:ATP-binding cassette domain-containing protein [Flavobacteriales bacterium]
MLAIQNISVQFGGEVLFADMSFMVNKGDRIGLVGKNGAGKSTLLKIIHSKKGFDSGSVNLQKEMEVGYLSQDIDFVKGNTVLEEAEKAFERIKQVQKELNFIQEELVNRTDYESEEYLEIINKCSELEHELNVIGGYTFHAHIEKVLFGLGFKSEDLTKLTDTFSGGWRMRIELAKVLLSNPDVLLLDEPTNHLDIESIVWLENFLRSYAGAVILVSHDRAFLDQVTNRTIEIANRKVYDYKAPYTKYLQLRQERLEQQVAVKKNQDKEIKQTEELIDKFRYKASKAAFAQSLIKKLDKMDRVEVDATDLKKMNFSFPESTAPGKVILEIEQLSKFYGEKKVIQNLDLQIDRGDRLAFVGQNGQGKTTLIKCITEAETHQGSIKTGHNVDMSYFAQNQAELLDPEKRVIDVIEDVADDKLRSRSRDMLGSFLFSGDDVEKKVSVLSGGERSRLALCKMLLQSSNFLILDEPTNHLDIISKEVLKNALKSYQGTLVIVSHDRDFLAGLSNKIIEFRDGQIKTHLGDINDYLSFRKVESMREIEKRSKELKKPVKVQLGKEDRKVLEKEIKKVNNLLSKAERKIDDLEKFIAKCDVDLADPQKSESLLSDAEFFANYQKSKDDLDQQMEDWEKYQSQMETLLAKR